MSYYQTFIDDYTNDYELFVHDNRDTDIIEFLPPVGKMTDEQYDKISQRYMLKNAVLDFGEGWHGMSKHVLSMTALERIILEDCHNGSGTVQRPGMNIPQLPKLSRIEYIAGQCKCSLDQAEDLIDFWKIIDDSPRSSLWPTFIEWTQIKGIEPALEYFETLAGELVDDECFVNDKPIENSDPWTTSEDQSDEDQTDEDQPDVDDAFGALDRIWQSLTVPENKFDFTNDEIDRIFDRYGFTVDGKFIVDRGFSVPDLFRYSKINHQNDPVEIVRAIDPLTGQRTYKTFWSRQPKRFHDMVDFIDNARLAEINDVRKKAFEDKSFLEWASPYQKQRFWSRSKSRKCRLEFLKNCYISRLLRNLTHVEQKSLTMIRNCKSVKQASYYWHLIYSALEGKKDMGRKNFIEYVLKPELNKRQERLKVLPDISYDIDYDLPPVECYIY